MSVKLRDIVDLDDMNHELAEGYLTRRWHDQFPNLAIIGYTDKTQFDNHWTPTTRALRGVIYNALTEEVLARPFAKFFNYGDETNTTPINPDQIPLDVYDKVDGSLGIVYRAPDASIRIATRGSFHSEQAEHATALLQADQLDVDACRALINYDDATPLYEIIYPENRIVVDYHGQDKLIYLGKIINKTGEYKPPMWGSGDRIDHYYFPTVRAAIESPPRANSEGFVIWLDSFTPVKFKYEEYKALHRIVSSLSKKEVWRQLRDGTFEEFVIALPDEFYAWAITTAGELQDEADAIAAQAYLDYREHAPRLGEGKKEFAMAVKDLPNSGYVFSLSNGRDIAPAIWKAIEPYGKDGNG